MGGPVDILYWHVPGVFVTEGMDSGEFLKSDVTLFGFWFFISTAPIQGAA